MAVIIVIVAGSGSPCSLRPSNNPLPNLHNALKIGHPLRAIGCAAARSTTTHRRFHARMIRRSAAMNMVPPRGLR
jgi:hypothetical protein